MRDREPIGPEAGGALIEFALTAALFLLCICVVLDFTMVSYRQAMLTKAVHLAARRAVVSDPVRAEAILTWEKRADRAALGDSCDFENACPTVDLVCDGRSGDPCAETPAFIAMLSDIAQVVPGIGRDHLSVAYRSAALGFVGRPGGVPLFVTLRVSCAPSWSIMIYHLVAQQAVGASRCEPDRLRRGVIEARVTLLSENLGAN